MRVRKHEHLRYYVESETTPGKKYLVDLLESRCECPNFRCVRARENPPTECKHFEPVLIEFAREMLLEIRKHVKSYDGP